MEEIGSDWNWVFEEKRSSAFDLNSEHWIQQQQPEQSWGMGLRWMPCSKTLVEQNQRRIAGESKVLTGLKDR